MEGRDELSSILVRADHLGCPSSLAAFTHIADGEGGIPAEDLSSNMSAKTCLAFLQASELCAHIKVSKLC